MPVERRGQVIAFEIGSTGNGRNPIFNGRRQPSRGDTSRMNREVQVRICEGLGVKPPGPTRQTKKDQRRRSITGPLPTREVFTDRPTQPPVPRVTLTGLPRPPQSTLNCYRPRFLLSRASVFLPRAISVSPKKLVSTI